MHEMGLLMEMASTVERAAQENNIDKVSKITLEVGEGSGALPNVFTEVFPYVQQKFPVLDEAEIEMIMVPCKALCLDCNAVYDVMKQEGKCPRCQSRLKKILSGSDVVIREIYS